MINALASFMPGEHNWMKGAQMPGQSPVAQPEKRKGIGGGIMNALSTVFEYGAPEAFQAGRQNRMNKDIANALSQGNAQGAAQAAYGAGDWQTGMKLGEYGQNQQDAQRKREAQGALQLFTSLQPGQVTQYAMEDPAGFERMTGMSSDEYMQMGQRFTQMGVTPEQFADYVVKQAQAELGITPTQKDPLVVNNRVLDPNDPSRVLGDYSDPLVVNNQIVDRSNYGVQADLRTPETPKYATTTTEEGVFGYNTADPTDRVRMGGAPAKGDAGPDAADEGTIRREYMSATRSFRDVQDAYQRIKSTDSNTAAGQMSLVFQYMKMLDPASTVREGEYANAQNTTGVPGQVINAYNRALEGKFLNPEQVAEFEAQAGKLYMGALDGYNNVRSVYESVVSGYPGMDTGRVLPDFAMADLRFTPPPQPQTQTAPSNLTPDEQAELERLRKELGGR